MTLKGRPAQGCACNQLFCCTPDFFNTHHRPYNTAQGWSRLLSCTTLPMVTSSRWLRLSQQVSCGCWWLVLYICLSRVLTCCNRGEEGWGSHSGHLPSCWDTKWWDFGQDACWSQGNFTTSPSIFFTPVTTCSLLIHCFSLSPRSLVLLHSCSFTSSLPSQLQHQYSHTIGSISSDHCRQACRVWWVPLWRSHSLWCLARPVEDLLG